MHIPNNITSKYMKQKLTKLKGEIDKFTVITGDFNSQLSTTDSTNRF